MALLTETQFRHWFSHNLDETGCSQNIACCMRLRGTISVDRLDSAIRQTIVEHPIFESRIDDRGGVPELVRGKVPEPTLLICGSIEEAETECRSFCLRTFDVSRDALGRFLIVKVCSEEVLLAVALHHIIADGPSLSLFLESVSAHYVSLASPKARSIPGNMQRAYEGGDTSRREADVAWFANQLIGHQGPIPLLGGAGRSGRAAVLGKVSRTRLEGPGIHALLQGDTGRNMSAAAMLMALTSISLYAHLGLTKFVFGVPFNYRKDERDDRTIGCFVNPLAVCIRLDPRLPAREVLVTAQNAMAEALSRASTPFEDVVRASGQRQNFCWHPLYQIQLNSYLIKAECLSIPGVAVQIVWPDQIAMRVDLDVYFDVGEDRIDVLSVRNPDVVAEDQLTEIFQRFDAICSVLNKQDDKALSLVVKNLRGRTWAPSYLTGAAVAPRWLNLAEAITSGLCAGNQRAIVSPSYAFSGENLLSAARHGAANLAAMGAIPGCVIGVAADNSPTALVALLSIVLSGAAFLPFDPALPKSRLTTILQEARCDLVIRTEGTSLPEGLSIAVVVFTEKEVVLPALRPDRLRPSVPAEIAYVLYTSGSTGRPKGVLVSQSSLCNTLAWTVAQYGLNDDDVFLWRSSLTFDISLLEIFAPLVAGASIAVPGEVLSIDWRGLAEFMTDTGVTIAQFVPSLLPSFCAVVAGDGIPSLRHLIVTGEALHFAVAREVARVLRCKVWNNYGPTEAAIHVSSRDAGEKTNSPHGIVPLGDPVWNTRLYVLNDALEHCARGIEGDLVIAGANLAMGYLRRRDLTLESFLPAPQLGESRIYLTGDRVRLTEAGELEFLGRQDNQIKLRGQRVELAEIEGQLSIISGVRGAAVAVVGTGETANLVAVVEVSDGAVTKQTLLDTCNGALPSYMAIYRFVLTHALPRLASGKIDRSAICLLAESCVMSGSDIAPEEVGMGPIALQIASVWARLLERNCITKADCFFELGGNSLLAMRMLREVEGIVGHSIQIRTIFDESTLSAFSMAVSEPA